MLVPGGVVDPLSANCAIADVPTTDDGVALHLATGGRTRARSLIKSSTCNCISSVSYTHLTLPTIYSV